MGDHSQRALITGVAAVAPNGGDTGAYWAATLSGVSGLRPISRFEADGYPVRVAGLVDDLNPAEQQEIEYEGLHGTKVETPEDVVLFKADATAIQKALEQLPTQFREVIVLREINQMNYRDIAEITNVPIGTVMSRLSRGRQLLIELLGDRN